MLKRSTIRFLLVGGACAATYNAIVISGAWLGIHYLISTLFSYVVVVILGYLLHSRFTFVERTNLASFVRYAIAMAANLPLSLILMFSLCDVGGVSVAVASPVTTALLVVWNYGASRWAIGGKSGAQRFTGLARR